ncbi:hypothetical protein G6O67_005318 [Ophiocordyceps sinensis]|uniref:Uncharacterized protein n=2 Tax=Ophiocordyceps sinensis TaxID=72228 RepID=A0A8H4PRA5_9HYPO|nr:hypothetical protein OCS_02825 [Ophiocordyceps sinensis CO18]KAF4509004.1 hypothetical protein G6O67_005318 [Ophiocordyceps sinensis]
MTRTHQRRLCNEERRLAGLEFWKRFIERLDPVLAEFLDHRDQGTNTRVFGSVQYVRGYAVRESGYYSDWYLIRLDPAKFQTPLLQLRNRVLTGHVPSMVQVRLDDLMAMSSPPSDTTVALEGIIERYKDRDSQGNRHCFSRLGDSGAAVWDAGRL